MIDELKEWLHASALVGAAIIVGFLALILSGCGAGFYSGNTKASYLTPDGKQISYESNKELTGLDVEYEVYADGRLKKIHIKVDKAGTQDAVIAASLQQSLATTKLVESLVPLIKAAATKGMAP